MQHRRFNDSDEMGSLLAFFVNACLANHFTNPFLMGKGWRWFYHLSAEGVVWPF